MQGKIKDDAQLVQCIHSVAQALEPYAQMVGFGGTLQFVTPLDGYLGIELCCGGCNHLMMLRQGGCFVSPQVAVHHWEILCPGTPEAIGTSADTAAAAAAVPAAVIADDVNGDASHNDSTVEGKGDIYVTEYSNEEDDVESSPTGARREITLTTILRSILCRNVLFSTYFVFLSMTECYC